MNRIFIILAAAVLLLPSCAKKQTTSTGAEAKEYLDLYVKHHKEFADIIPDQWGIYLIDETPGTGADWNPDLPYSLISYTIRTLEGNISSSTEAAIAQQLDQDTYKEYNYYGPEYKNTAEGSGYAGLEYLLKGMKVGGSRFALVPSWLLTTSRYSTQQGYLDNCTVSTHVFYEVTLAGQSADVAQQERDDIAAFVTLYGEDRDIFPATPKSCKYKSGQTEGTFYFASDTTAFKEEDKRADDAVLYLKYTCRRVVDGQAVDTNVKAVALDEGLYTQDNTYEKVKITFSETYSSIQMNSSSSLIDGFQGALYKMHWAGQKAVVVFVSDLGYGSTGSGKIIPPYAPLLFELELSAEK